MSVDPFAPPKPGDPSPFLTNLDTIGAALEVLRNLPSPRGQPKPGTGGGLDQRIPYPHHAVLVRNDTGAALPALSVLELGDPIQDPEDKPHDVFRLPAFGGTAPTGGDGPFGILLEPAGVNSLAAAAVLGVAVCDLVVNSDDDLFAVPAAGTTATLNSTGSGPARVLWKAGTSGTQRAIVMLLGGSDLPFVREAIAYGTICDDGRYDIGLSLEIPAAGIYEFVLTTNVEIFAQGGPDVTLVQSVAAVWGAPYALLGGSDPTPISVPGIFGVTETYYFAWVAAQVDDARLFERNTTTVTWRYEFDEADTVTVYFFRGVGGGGSWNFNPNGEEGPLVSSARLTAELIRPDSPTATVAGAECGGEGSGSGGGGSDIPTDCCPDDPVATTLSVAVSGGGPSYQLDYWGYFGPGSGHIWQDLGSGSFLRLYCVGGDWFMSFDGTAPGGESNDFTFVSATCDPLALVFTNVGSGKTYTVTE